MHDNLIHGNIAAGINIGSNVSGIELEPTKNVYLIGNILSDNSRYLTQNYTGTSRMRIQENGLDIKGISSNGPVEGCFIANNEDPQGLVSYMLIDLSGTCYVQDPLHRAIRASVFESPLSPSPISHTIKNNVTSDTFNPIDVPSNYTPLNATITKGYLFLMSTDKIYRNTTVKVDPTCRGIQSVINAYFSHLQPQSASKVVWMWGGTKLDKVFSFLELQFTEFTCDSPLFLPNQFFLVFNNSRLIATEQIIGSPGLIVAKSSYYSGVLSRGTGLQSLDREAVQPQSAHIDCSIFNTQAGRGVPGLYVYNTSYFIVDGLLLYGCGSGGRVEDHEGGAITVVGVPNGGNNTMISNSVVAVSNGPGIVILSTMKSMIHNTVIYGSYASGVALLGNSWSPIITSSVIRKSRLTGLFSDGTSNFVVSGNYISGNVVGITLTSSRNRTISRDNIIIRNTIIRNVDSR